MQKNREDNIQNKIQLKLRMIMKSSEPKNKYEPVMINKFKSRLS